MKCLQLAVVTFGLIVFDSCRQRSDQSSATNASDGAKPESKIHQEIEDQLKRLDASVIDKLNQTRVAVNQLSEAELRSEFMRLTGEIFSKDRWAAYQALNSVEKLKDPKNKQLRDDFVRYTAIRARAEKYNSMKEDVFRTYFERNSKHSNMISLDKDQFLDPVSFVLGGGGSALVMYGVILMMDQAGCPHGMSCGDGIAAGFGVAAIGAAMAAFAIAAELPPASSESNDK